MALLGVGVANLPAEWSQTTGPVRTVSGSPTPDRSAEMASVVQKAEAEQRCHAALAQQPQGTKILFVSATTVEAVRRHSGGPEAAALAGEPWASLNGSDTAAWCTLQTGGTYKIIAATRGGASITFVTSNQPLSDPGPEGPSIP